MKKIIKATMAASLVLGLSACSNPSQDANKTRIGIVQLAEHPALDQAYEGFMEAMKDAGYTEENTIFDVQNASNDLSNCDTIADKLVSDQCDLIYAIATPAAQSVAGKTTEIPIVVSAVTDPSAAGLVEENEAPQTNVTGASDLTPVYDQIDLLKQIVPDVKKVAIMYCSSEDNSIVQAKLAKKAMKDAGLSYVEATVSDSNMIQQVTESLIGKVDAIYIPTDNLLAEGMSTVTQVANVNDLPCIVGEVALVEKGGLATYGINYVELGRLAGEQAVSILKGEKEVSQIPVAYLPADKCELAINTTVADQLGIKIPQDVLEKAVVIE